MKDIKTAARNHVARISRKRTAVLIDLDLELSAAVRTALASGNRYQDLYESAAVRNDPELWRLLLPPHPERDVSPTDPSWVTFSEAARITGESLQIVKKRVRSGEMKLGFTSRGKKLVRISA